MKKIFCFTGKTGAGKSTYLDNIMKLVEKENDINISPLVYSTTRPKRSNEIEGKDYYFITQDEYYKLPTNSIIESRMYDTVRGPMYYFTTVQSLQDSDNYIAAVSIEQLANYIKSAYIDHKYDFKVYRIHLNCDLRSRFDRTYKNRVKSDNDLLELCRRVLQEQHDFANEEVNKLLNMIHKNDILEVDNSDSLTQAANEQVIYDWIKTKL